MSKVVAVPKSITIAGEIFNFSAAYELTNLSAPASFGLSILIFIPKLKILSLTIKVLTLKYFLIKDFIFTSVSGTTDAIDIPVTQLMSNLDISNIFKVRKTGENLNSVNIENTHERLQAAVSKEPHPSLYNRPNDLSKKLSQSSKSTLNSFLQKMTSFRGKKIDTQSEKKLPPNFTIPTKKIPNVEDNSIDQSENAKTQEENYKEEIPAFLRRQAN